MSGHELLIQHNNMGNVWFMALITEGVGAFNLVTPERNNNEYAFIDAQADQAGERPAMGMVVETVNAETARVVTLGFVHNGDWTWTAGDTLYLGDTPGLIQNSAGTVRQEVGIALSATTIWFCPKSIDLDT